MSDDGEFQDQHTVSLTETSWTDRLRKFMPYLPKEIPLFATVVISFWGIAEVLSELGGESLSLRILAAPALITALVVAAYKAIQKFRTYVPEDLVTESKITQSIFRKGKCGWQFALARQMLTERTDNFDRTLGRVKNGSHFLYPRHLETSEYIAWLKERPEVLTRLIRAVAVQCVSEIPSILATTRDETSLSALSDSVAQLSSLYEATVDFELQSHGTHPPTELSDVHEMIYGWSDPIRLGIQEFLNVLKSVSEISAKDIKNGTVALPSFEIKFASPPNIDEFVRRLGKVKL